MAEVELESEEMIGERVRVMIRRRLVRDKREGEREVFG